MSDIETLAKQAVKAARKLPSWEPEDGSDSAMLASLVGMHRDSTLLPTSNFEVVSEDMRERFPADVETVRFRHWGVGWIDEFMVRVYDSRGVITPAFEAAAEWRGALEEYPVARDDDYSQREYEATLANIEDVGFVYISPEAPPGWAGRVYSWFSEHNQSAVENRDDQGGYPSDEEMKEALEDLGWLAED